MRVSRGVRPLLAAFAAVSAILGAASTALASGNDISAEGSARLLGRAGAGRAADAETALAAAFNPAQLSALPGRNLSVSAGYIAPRMESDVTTVFGSVGQDDFLDDTPVGGFAISSYVNEQLSVGFSVTPSFGLIVDHGAGFSAAALVSHASLRSVAFSPAVSVALTDRLSFGVAPILEVAALDYRSTLPGFGSADRDYQKDLGWGALFGLRYEPTDHTNIGLTFRLSPDHDFEGDVSGAFSGSSDFKIDQPNVIEASVQHELPEVATLFASVSWIGWSVVEQTTVVEPTNPFGDVVAPRDWDDGWRFSLGVETPLAEKLTGRAGVAYSTSFISADRRVPDAPYDNQLRLALGLSYDISDRAAVHLGYEYVDLGDNPVALRAADYGGIAASGDLEGVAHVVGVELSFGF